MKKQFINKTKHIRLEKIILKNKLNYQKMKKKNQYQNTTK